MMDWRKIELKAFDDTRKGVKGIVDSGNKKIPRIFIHEKNEPIAEKSNNIKKLNIYHQIPIIDLDEGANHSEKINQIIDACENWGFFQVINHGVPLIVMENMLESIRMFHERDDHEMIKRALYGRDSSRTAVYHSNIDLYHSKAAVWKDTITFKMVPSPPDLQEIPIICR